MKRTSGALLTLLTAVALLAGCESGGAVTPAPTSPTPRAAPSAAGTPPAATATGAATPTPAATASPIATSAARPPVATLAPPQQPPPTPVPPPSATPSATPAPQPSATPTLAAGRKRMLAPIDQLDIRVAESAPPQFFADLTSGLPGGCARFDHYTVERSGTVITITVWNTMPAVEGPCTAIYGYVQHTITLGSDFPAGAYLVRANGVSASFTAP